MNFYIITGVSRGIGEAIARRLLVEGNTLFCASRTLNEDLVETAYSKQIPLFYHETDLSVKGASESFMGEVFQHINPEQVSGIALINNAGMLEPIAPIEQADHVMMEKHLYLNLLAPALLISSFLAGTKNLSIPKVVLNISSGASFTPFSGWAMYCSSKAGLDMLTRTVALEQSSSKYPSKILSLAPGIVDTAMQNQIRNTDKALFAEKARFVMLHEEGRLSTPDSVAEIISETLFNPHIPQGSILTIEQMEQYLPTA